MSNGHKTDIHEVTIKEKEKKIYKNLTKSLKV